MSKTLKLLVVAAAATLATAAAAADDPWAWARWLASVERHKEVAPVRSPRYAEECRACHYAYPPGLLPQASWQKLLAADALPDHFGENIEMDEALRTELLAYAAQNAADRSLAKRSRRIVASLGDGAAPLRITEVPYIRRKHQEIPQRLVQGNPKVKSLAMCDACHPRADAGDLDDDQVLIPGYGRARW